MNKDSFSWVLFDKICYEGHAFVELGRERGREGRRVSWQAFAMNKHSLSGILFDKICYEGHALVDLEGGRERRVGG